MNDCVKGSRPEFAELLDALKEQLSYMGYREVSYESWLQRQVLELRDNAVNKNCNIPRVSNLLCGLFEPKNDSSSATICKHCGREKWMHTKAT